MLAPSYACDDPDLYLLYVENYGKKYTEKYIFSIVNNISRAIIKKESFIETFMPIRLYNTLSRTKEEFVPQSPGKVGFYACGPTVYHYAHLGNLRAYVFMDVLHRVLRYHGYNVNLVVNITDVGHLTDDADQGEDKMEKGAAREGKSVWDIAAHYTAAFMEDVKSLNIKQPTTWCKATDHIPQQIKLIKDIEENGFAYQTSDGVYFDTSKLDDYGKLIAGFDKEGLQAGKRVDMGEKRNATDFALWKFSPKNETRQMEWDSPWGRGFPGWHIECTAMGCHYLGEQFDIHTGGIDHIPVHHTNEIAQAQGAFGRDHVRFWMHNEFLVTDGEKMAKSKGEFLRLASVIEKGFSALDYRYFCLLTHYRKPLTFTWEAIEAAATARKRLTQRVAQLKESAQPAGLPSAERLEFQKQFAAAVYDDCNTSQALGVVHELLKSDLSDGEKLALLLDWDSVLGLKFAAATIPSTDVPKEVQALVDEREVARKNKDWAQADKLRAEIAQRGFLVSDSEQGPVVSQDNT